MAELPQIANVIPQVRAPESRVSPADIAQPRQLLAQNLARAGEMIEKEVAEPFAEKAGHEAVRTDPEGNLIVDRTPIFGPASITYKRAAMETALSQTLPRVESDLNDLKNRYPNQPGYFSIAAKEYTDETVKNLPPDLRMPVRAHAVRAAEHNYRSLTDQAAQTNLNTFLETQKAALKGLREDMTSLARQGGVDTPEYLQKSREMFSIYATLRGDPRVMYPQARAEQEISDHLDEDSSQAIIGVVLRTYKNKANAVEAQHALIEAFSNPDLKLSQQKRDQGVATGLRLLERVSVEDKVEVQQFRSAINTYSDNIMKRPDTFDIGAHNDLRQRANELGDFRTGALLDQVKAFHPIALQLKSMTVPEQNEFMRKATKNVFPDLPIRLGDAGIQGMIEQEAQRQGVSPQLAVTIAAQESGGRPREVTGSYKGIFQLSDTGFAKFFGGPGGDIFNSEHNIRAGIASLKADTAAFEKQFGRQPTATEIYLSHQQGEGGIAAHLRNPDVPAWQNMRGTGEGANIAAGRQKYLGQTGPEAADRWARDAIKGNLPDNLKPLSETMTSAQFMQVWENRIQNIPYAGTGLTVGQPVATSGIYAQKLWESTLKHMGETAGHSATRLKEQIVSQLDKNVAVTPQDIETFVTSATLSGKTELIEPVRTALTAFEAAQPFTGKPGGLAALQGQIAAMEGAPEGIGTLQYRALKQAQTIVENNAKEWADTPLIAGANSQTIKPPNQLKYDNPAQVTAEFARRQGDIRLLQEPAGHNVGNISAIADDKTEGVALNTALTRGDPKAAAAILEGMQTSLKPETFKATMSSPQMKSALSGMIRSKDPTRMTAAFSTLDALWQKDSVGFERDFSGDVELLQVWHGLRESFTAAEIADRINQANDPSKVAALNASKKAAEDEAKAWKPDAIAYQMGTAWGLTSWIPGSGIVSRNITGATPSAPPVIVGLGDVGAEMQHDFATIYTGLRTYGVPEGSFFDGPGTKNAKTLAAARLQSKWNISAVAGNQIMAFPPDLVSTDKKTGERTGFYYPMVDGSHDWMKEQLNEMIVGALGPQQLAPIESRMPVPLGIGRKRWTLVGLASDATTQAEITAKKPPSYLAIVNTGNGLNEILRDPTTGSTRIYFDPTKAIAKMRGMATAINRLSQPLTQEQEGLAPGQPLEQGQFLRNVREAVGGGAGGGGGGEPDLSGPVVATEYSRTEAVKRLTDHLTDIAKDPANAEITQKAKHLRDALQGKDYMTSSDFVDAIMGIEGTPHVQALKGIGDILRSIGILPKIAPAQNRPRQTREET